MTSAHNVTADLIDQSPPSYRMPRSYPAVIYDHVLHVSSDYINLNQNGALEIDWLQSITIWGLNLTGPCTEDEHLSLGVVNSVQETQHM